MKSYIITYQLTLPESSYPNLITFLKSAPKWARPSATVWLIGIDSDAAVLRDSIKTKLLSTDRLLVMEALKNYNWPPLTYLKKLVIG